MHFCLYLLDTQSRRQKKTSEDEVRKSLSGRPIQKVPVPSLESVPGPSEQELEDISDEKLPFDEPDQDQPDRTTGYIVQSKEGIREEAGKETSRLIVKSEEENFQRRYNLPQKCIPKSIL